MADTKYRTKISVHWTRFQWHHFTRNARNIRSIFFYFDLSTVGAYDRQREKMARVSRFDTQQIITIFFPRLNRFQFNETMLIAWKIQINAFQKKGSLEIYIIIFLSMSLPCKHDLFWFFSRKALKQFNSRHSFSLKSECQPHINWQLCWIFLCRFSVPQWIYGSIISSGKVTNFRAEINKISVVTVQTSAKTVAVLRSCDQQ